MKNPDKELYQYKKYFTDAWDELYYLGLIIPPSPAEEDFIKTFGSKKGVVKTYDSESKNESEFTFMPHENKVDTELEEIQIKDIKTI